MANGAPRAAAIESGGHAVFAGRSELRTGLPDAIGTEEAPITISSYPGELAVLDEGRQEFLESPETSWQPFTSGAEGEYVSTRTYLDADDSQVPHQSLPGSWEPLWGIEEERPLVVGHFADSLVPLHR